MIEHCDLQQFRPSVSAYPELTKHYLSSATYYGDAVIKRDIVQHRRTLNGLKKVRTNSSVLDAVALASIESAITVIEEHIKKLVIAASWANELHAHYEMKLNHRAGRDSLLFQKTRWQGSKQAMEFELDLVRELTTRNGLADFCDWLHAKNLISCVPQAQFFGPFKVCATGQYEDQTLVCALMDLHFKSSAMTPGPSGSSYVFGWRDYCDHLQYRREQVMDVRAILKNIAGK